VAWEGLRRRARGRTLARFAITEQNHKRGLRGPAFLVCGASSEKDFNAEDAEDAEDAEIAEDARV